ncbi:MAG: hypothetical protein PHG58_10205, partial [Clostridia bacterium]|nr:hypothetical protein [Clostridia bacterium]
MAKLNSFCSKTRKAPDAKNPAIETSKYTTAISRSNEKTTIRADGICGVGRTRDSVSFKYILVTIYLRSEERR